jgi:hypothetical protein
MQELATKISVSVTYLPHPLKYVKLITLKQSLEIRFQEYDCESLINIKYALTSGKGKFPHRNMVNFMTSG